jgi:peptide/nickel transport system substrate-binding protein
MLFVLSSVLVILQARGLSDFYQTLRPVPGGVYTEGMVGTFTNANPLYASGAADAAVSRLVFSGLFAYDTANKLTPYLAERIDLDAKETKYVVTLKKDIKWHDGKEFDADDVIFTYKTIQNQDAKSSLFSSWQGIKVIKKDDFVVVFELPNPLSSFPHALVNGIVPEHLLKDIPPVQLRSSNFNIAPVGTGPFKWKFVEVKGGDNKSREQRITLAPYDEYFAGKPKLDSFSIRTFRDELTLVNAFKKNELNAMSGLELLPETLTHDAALEVQTTPLTSQIMAFMNNSKDHLKDPKVRSALVQAINKQQIIMAVEYPAGIIDEPLLKGQLGYNKTFAQPGFSLAAANQLLDQAGYVKGTDGMRTKDGKSLALVLRSQNNLEYTSVAQVIQQQWNQIGVKTEVKYHSADDLQSSIIPGHEYDVLLYGISVGVDPDVFPYWHSSQAGPTSPSRINLSEYKSTTADSALEAGRLRSDPAQRALKYQPFLAAWKNDSPAVALYQPTYLYLSKGKIYGYERTAMNAGIDRFYNVNNWMVREQKQNL